MSTQPAAAPDPSILLPAFEDGLGRRYRPSSRNTETPQEILCFRHDLTDVPSFEFSLRERVARLADFRHPFYARIRKVDRLSDDRGTVALISDCARGTRLVDILAAIEGGGPVLSIDAALSLVRQLVAAMMALHDTAHVAHGAIAPERLIVMPSARLFIVEHVIGAALEQLRYSRERYWNELRLALPMSVGLPHFDARADLTQLGVVALALILGRRLGADEYPGAVDDLVATAHSRSADGSREPLPAGLREWLRRTLQLDARHSFPSLSAAHVALEQLLSAGGKYNAEISAVEAFLVSAQAPAVPVVVQPPAWKPNLAVEVPATRIDISPRFEPQPIAASISAEAEPDEEEDIDEDDEQSEDAVVPQSSSRSKWIAGGLVLAMAIGGGIFAARHLLSPAPVIATGTLAIDTTPYAGRVDVDGVDRGVAPVRLSLTPGAHVLTVRGNGEPRVMLVTIEAGTDLTRHVELPAPTAAFGQVQVNTEPSGARVSVDGVAQGTTPLTVTGLVPGEHTVKVESNVANVSQLVTIEAGVTSSLIVPLVAATPIAPAAGWVSVSAPFVMDIYEQGRMLGNSGIERIMLAAGEHQLEIVNEPLGFREARTVRVTPGKLAVVGITLPKGTLSLNATPWANVAIDGESVGETPIGNLSLTIGPHEVVFTNPQLGEQRRVITVSEREPRRFSIDMTKK